MLRVLILCTGNSARSQIAEAILRHVSKGSIDVHSAGTAPQPRIHPMAREAVRRLLGVEMDGQQPKHVNRYGGQSFDYVITVCDAANDACPVFPGPSERIHWSYPDPAAVSGTAADVQRAFDDVASDMKKRIDAWLAAVPRR